MRKNLPALIFGGIQLVLGIAMIVWGIEYGYANYQGDRCNEAFATVLESNQARINAVQARIEKTRARELAVQARLVENAKTSNGAKDAK